MVFLSIFLIVVASILIFSYRRDDGYDKIATACFLAIVIFMTFCFATMVKISSSYLSASDVGDMVTKCQKDLPPYAKCIITVTKPKLTENQP